MGISIRGIRVDKLSWEREEDADKITGSYSLMSNADKVLAKQSINGYGDVKVTFSVDTMTAFYAFMQGAKKDIEGILGLVEEKGSE